MTALNDRIRTFNYASQVIKERGGPNPGEAIWLNREYTAITAEQEALTVAARPYEADIDAAERALRVTDLAYADASSNPAWADDLRGAFDRHNRINGLYQRLSVSSQPRQQKLSETFGRLTSLTELGYNYVRDRRFDAPRNYERGVTLMQPGQSLYGGRALPSTMLRDFAYVHTAAQFLDEWKSYDGEMRDATGWPSLDGQAALAAVGFTPQMQEASLLPRETNWRDDETLTGLVSGENAEQIAENVEAVQSRIEELSADGRAEAITMPYQNPDGSRGYVTLFRVKQEDGSYRYIDQTGAHFGDLQDFRDNNEILSEDGSLIAIENLDDVEGLDQDGLARGGEAPTGCDGCRIVETSGHTPAGWWDKFGGYVVGGLMVAGGVLLWAGGGIATIATLGAASPLGAAAAIGGTALIAGGVAYTTVDAISNINNRSAHGQSNSWSNPAARADYLNLAGNVLTVVGVGVGIKAAAAGAAQATARTAVGSLGVRGATTAGSWAGRARQWATTAAPGWQTAWNGAQRASGTTLRGMFAPGVSTATRVATGANALAFGTFVGALGDGGYQVWANRNKMSSGELLSAIGNLAMGVGMLGMPLAISGLSRWTSHQAFGLPKASRNGTQQQGPMPGADPVVQNGPLSARLNDASPLPPGRPVGGVGGTAGGLPTGPGGRPMSPRQLVRAMGEQGVTITRAQAREMLAADANRQLVSWMRNNQGRSPDKSASELVAELGVTRAQARDALRAINGSRMVEHVNSQSRGPVRETAGQLVRDFGVSRGLAKGALRVAGERGLGELAAKIADGTVKPLSTSELAKEFNVSRSTARAAVRMAANPRVMDGLGKLASGEVRPMVDEVVSRLGVTRSEAKAMIEISRSPRSQGLKDRMEAIARGEYRTLTRRALASEFGVGRGQVRATLRVARNVAMLEQLGRLAEGGARPSAQEVARNLRIKVSDAENLLRVAENAGLIARIGQVARAEIKPPSATALARQFGITEAQAEWALRVAGNAAVVVEIGQWGVLSRSVRELASTFGASRSDVRAVLGAGSSPELAWQLWRSASHAIEGLPQPPATGEGATTQTAGTDVPVLVSSSDGDPAAPGGPGDGPADPATPGAPGHPDGAPVPSPVREVPRGSAGPGRPQQGGDSGSGGPEASAGGGPPDGPGGPGGGPGTTSAGHAHRPNPVTGTASGVPPPSGKPISVKKLARAMRDMVSRPIEDVAREIRTGLFRKHVTVEELRSQLEHRRGELQEYRYAEYELRGERLVFVQRRQAAPEVARRASPLDAVRDRSDSPLESLQELWAKAVEDKALADVTATFLGRRLRGAGDGERSGVKHELRAAQDRAHQLGEELRAFRKHTPEIEEALRPFLKDVKDVEALLAEWVSNRQNIDELLGQWQRGELSTELSAEAQQCALVCYANYVTPKGTSRFGELPYDVQIAAVMALSRSPARGRLEFLGLRNRLPRGVVVQMLTGEGKTLVARLWALQQALTGKGKGEGVVVMTHNSTLAESAAERAKAVAEQLGLTVRFRRPGDTTRVGIGAHEPDGFLGAPEPPVDLHKIYEADIVYGSAREIVGDWQRGLHDPSQRFGPRHVIMDEVDMLAIDWGRTAYRLGEQVPGAVSNVAEMYALAKLARQMREGVDYSVVGGRAWISPEQAKAFAERIGLGGELTARHVTELTDALTTGRHHLPDRHFYRDGDNAVILDPENGEGLPGTRWFKHGWVEAHHGLTIKPPLRTLSEKTLLDYLNAQLSRRGVTGTAKAAKSVLRQVYDLDVIPMAPNDPRRLAELPRRVFADNPALQRSIAEEILEAHRRGDPRPRLILLRDIADARTFATMLTEVLARGPHKVEPRVVDAKTPNQLYEFVAQSEAGTPFAVTVATAKFGRGTDIGLGGASTADRAMLIEQGGGHVEIISMFGTRRAVQQGGGRFGRNGQPGTWRESLSLRDPQLARFANSRLLRRLQNHSEGELTGRRLRQANKMITKAQLRADEQRATELRLTVEGKLLPDNVVEQVVNTHADSPVDQAAAAVQEAQFRLEDVP